jgi:hypothetical protein
MPRTCTIDYEPSSQQSSLPLLRESARRSRLRKLAESVDIDDEVELLAGLNNKLADQLERLLHAAQLLKVG